MHVNMGVQVLHRVIVPELIPFFISIGQDVNQLSRDGLTPLDVILQEVRVYIPGLIMVLSGFIRGY